MKFNKLNTILGIIVLECLAVVGALPLFQQQGSWGGLTSTVDVALWDDQEIAFIGFLILAVGMAFIYTRKEPIKVQVSATMVAVGLPLLTIGIMRALP